jgi:hypothetical protein
VASASSRLDPTAGAVDATAEATLQKGPVGADFQADVVGLGPLHDQLDDFDDERIAPRRNDLTTREPGSWRSLAVPCDVGTVGRR